MSEQNKYRTLWIVILCLLAINTIMLGWIWFAKPPQNAMPPERMVNELGFDAQQLEAFEKLKTEHFAVVTPLRDSIRILMRESYDLTKSDTLDKALLHQNMQDLSSKIVANEENTREHLYQVRKLCTPGQREIFDNKVLEIFKNQGENHRGGKDGERMPPPPR